MSDAVGAGTRWRLVCAWIVALAASNGIRRRDAIASERRTKFAILALCLLLHLAFLALLRRQDEAVGRVESAHPLLIEFIERRAAPSAPPPMPRARRFEPARALRAVRIDPPVPVRSDTEREALIDIVPSSPRGRRLLDALPGFAHSLRDEVGIAPRNLLQPPRPRLPGSDIAIVPGIRLRHRITPEDVVKAVGSVFGGNYDPCPDLMGKVHDATILQPGRYSDAERRALVERERHCRYR